MLSRKRRDGDDKSSRLASQLKGLTLLDIPHVVSIMYLLLLAGTLGLVYFGYEAMQGRGLSAEKAGRGASQLVISESIGNRGMLRSRSTYLDWEGESSEWFKRSPQGRFIFVFYEGVQNTLESLGGRSQQTSFDPIKQAMESLSLRSPSKYPFAYATVTTRDYVDTFSNILSDNFLVEEYPAVLLLDVIDGYKKYMLPLKEQFDMSNITSIDAEEFQLFIESKLLQPYQNKTLKPYLRSERLELEADGEDSHDVVKSINSTFFHQQLMTLEQEPEFFVVFYAPWCGHCRRFHELFRPLARLVRRKTQAIGFYKMDSTKNDIDHPSISVARVPHVRFFSKWHDMSNPVIFDHRAKEVTEENLKNFLATNSKNGKGLARTWRVGEVNLDEL